MERRARDVRDHYQSGRDLDERYGPVEPALAAAKVIAAWAGRPLAGGLPERARLALQALHPKQAPRKLVEVASEVVDHILRDEKYRRMRRLYLSAFPDVTGATTVWRAWKISHDGCARSHTRKPQRSQLVFCKTFDYAEASGQ